MIPLVGFAPDMDPTTAGVLTDCSNVIPIEGGLRGAPGPSSIGVSALAAACRGAASTSDLSGTRRLYAGTGTKLYELNSTTWTDRSRAGNYILGTDDRWSFIQYANATLAATPAAVIQRASGGAFADVAGSPQAAIIEAAAGFAVAFNTSSYADQWYCSTYLDETNWTLSVANQCVSGRLIGGSGPITAARRFGDDIVAYKGGSMFVGRYVGAPEVWRWTQVSTDVGCVGQEAVVDTAIGHVFVGKDNVYVFDGTTPRPLATGTIRRWLFADLSPYYAFKTILLWDRAAGHVWMYYVGASSLGVINRCAVYHVPTQRWGLAHSTIEAGVSYTSASATYDGGTPAVATYDASPSVPFDSLFWVTGSTSPSVFSDSHTLQALVGTTGAASFTTGDMGDDSVYSVCTKYRVRYSTKPTTSITTGYTKDEGGTVVASSSSASINDGRHDLRQRARWHRFKTETTGNFVVTAVDPALREAGAR